MKIRAFILSTLGVLVSPFLLANAHAGSNTAFMEFTILWDTRFIVRGIVNDTAANTTKSPIELCFEVGQVIGKMDSNLTYLQEYQPGNIPIPIGQSIAKLYQQYPTPNADFNGMSKDCDQLAQSGNDSTQTANAIQSLNVHATNYYTQLTQVIESLRPLQPGS